MSDGALSSKELSKENLRLIFSAGKISRIDYLNRMDALANKWDNFIISKAPMGKPIIEIATFASERSKLEAYYHEQGMNLDEIPEDGPLIFRKMPQADAQDDVEVPF